MNHLAMKTISQIFKFSLIFIVGVYLLSCKSLPGLNTKDTNQDHDYASLWAQVDSFDQLLRPQSALKSVLQIKNLATNRGDELQFIKTLIYENKYQLELGDLDLSYAIQQMEAELIGKGSPARQLLHSYIGELYDTYIRMNRWKLNDRQVRTEMPEDIQLMSQNDLNQKANEHFEESIRQADSLTLVLDSVSLLILPSPLPESHRYHNLYELLVNRYLDHLETPGYEKAGEAFPLDHEGYFLPMARFVEWKMEAPSSSGRRYQSLLVYQDALKELGSDGVDLDLRRLGYFHRISTNQLKDELYVNALKYLIDSDIGDFDKALVGYHLTLVYYQSDDRISAHIQCGEILKRFPESRAALQCRQLIEEIEATELSLMLEEVDVPDQASPVHIRFRNLDSIHFRLIRLSDLKQEEFRMLTREDQLRFILKHEQVYAKSIMLPQNSDFKTHTTEFILPGLPIGDYVLLAGTSHDFRVGVDLITGNAFHRSNLSFSNLNHKGETSILCFDRLTGSPLQGVTVQWFRQSYDRSRGITIRSKVSESISDQNGKAEVPHGNGSFLPVLSWDNDRLDLDNAYVNSYPWGTRDETTFDISYFLDRALYRPGQNVLFKAILLEKDQRGRPVIRPNLPVRLSLFDANGQEVSSLDTRSNIYGSVYGSFTLPETGLAGLMSIGVDKSSSRQFFRVEAYKRPGFKVQFDSISSAFQLSDTIRISGKVVSYSGAPLGNINCTYRVVRLVKYPYLPYFRRIAWPSAPERDIKNGSITTGSDGSFQLDFVALVDDLALAEHSPVFDFRIELSATDVSGETQANQTSITLGATPFGVQYSGQDLIDISQNNKLVFKAVNAQGRVIDAVDGELTIYHQETGEWRRERYWDDPETTLEDHDSLDQYRPLSVKDSQRHIVRTIRLSKENDQMVAYLDTTEMMTGSYVVKVGLTDQKGRTEYLEFPVDIVDPAKGYVPTRQLLFSSLAEEEIRPGDTVVVNIGSPVQTMIYYQIERNNSLSGGQWIKVTGWEQLKIPVYPGDEGGFFVHLQVAHQNRVEEKSIPMRVPWYEKQLVIQSESIRDLTQPGSMETVKLRVLQGGSGVESEILVSMFDASLDAIFPHEWNVDFYPVFQSHYQRFSPGYGVSNALIHLEVQRPNAGIIEPELIPYLNWFGFPLYGRMMMAEAAVSSRAQRMNAPPKQDDAADLAMKKSEGVEESEGEVKVREDFAENLFFYPNLQTDTTGRISFSYEMNDALTTWRLMVLAHTKALATGYSEYQIVSRKELMVTTNKPRFLRSGDDVVLTSKIDNLTDQDMNVQVYLELKNAVTQEELTMMFTDRPTIQELEITAGSASASSWRIRIPNDFHTPVEYTVFARSERHQDAEKGLLPVLTNQTYVTATRAFEIDPGDFTLDLTSLLGQNTGEGGKMTLDVTSNPVWYALKALPYLVEYPYECSEQIYNRFYANALGSRILRENPRLEAVFNQWKDEEKESPLAGLEEVKSAILEETPWVKDALDEKEQTRRIANYFNANNLRYQQRNTLSKLRSRQSADGGFSWFPDGPSNWYISQYIADGLADMKEWIDLDYQPEIDQILHALVPFLDARTNEYYQSISKEVKEGRTNWETNHLTPILGYYLKFRSQDFESLTGEPLKVYQYFMSQAAKYWKESPLLTQIHLVEAFSRREMDREKSLIVQSFRERKIYKESLGSYWKEYGAWYRWWEMPVNVQSRMIELFDREGDRQIVQEAKRWLLNNKRTNHWSSTIATSEAVKALLHGAEVMTVTKPVRLTGKSEELIPDQTDAETSFLRNTYRIPPSRLDDISTIQAHNPNANAAWGAAYYQFFAEIDQIKDDREGPMKIRRELFLEEITPEGVRVKPLSGAELQPGDVVVTSLTVESDRDVDFVQIKDLRPAALEPVEVLSEYDWRGGLGFYRTNTDVSTSFFLDNLPKGTYVFSYRLRVNQRGDFSGGYASIQSMYAPEFAAHSQGVRLKVNSVQ